MKSKDLKELREKDIKQLQSLVNGKRIEVLKMRAGLAVNRIKNFKVVKNARRDLSQMQTIIQEKRFEEK